MRPSHSLNLRSYTTHRYDHFDSDTANEETAIFVNDYTYIVCLPVNIQTLLRVQVAAFHSRLPILSFTVRNSVRSFDLTILWSRHQPLKAPREEFERT